MPYLAAGPLLGLACISIYAWQVGGSVAWGIGFLVAIAALLAGAIFGFLFAIPKNPAASAEDRPIARFISNSNLEEISDWLTKILVGLGLVQFGRLMDGGGVLVDSISSALGDDASSPTFAVAVLVTYGVSGFLAAYILTRVYLGPVFAQSEEAMRIYVEEQVEAAIESRAGIAPTPGN